jgi:hypothetical protein
VLKGFPARNRAGDTMTIRLLSGLVAMLVATAACGSDAADPPTPDAPDVPDAPAPRAAPPPNQAVSSAAGRLRGGTWVLDVQVGASFEQRRIERNGRTAVGGAPHIR